jgi:hypothetical protein
MPVPANHSLHRMFSGLTEYAFQVELGVADPELVDYVADLLARFVPASELYRVRDRTGRRLTQVAEMIAEAEASGDTSRRRDCHRHVGDFTLFWTGIFPEALGRLQGSGRVDALVDFREQGKRSYYLASTFDGEGAGVLRRLSTEFEMCAFGLSRIRREWERHEPEGPRGPILPIIAA